MLKLAAIRRSSGQSLIESIIVLPLFALLIFGVLEFAYMFHVKATLNAATFSGARNGALNSAKMLPIKEGMSGVLAALFVRSAPDLAKANVAKFKTLGLLSIPVAPRGWVDIVSPSKAVFNKFKKKGYVKNDGLFGSKEKYMDIIPNDNLMWRSTASQNVNSNGTTLKLNIQDANLLKIRTTWCHKLLVPVLDRFIHWTYTLTAKGTLPQIPGAEQLRCDLHAKLMGDDGYYIPLVSSAVVRMQTPVVGDDLK